MIKCPEKERIHVPRLLYVCVRVCKSIPKDHVFPSVILDYSLIAEVV